MIPIKQAIQLVVLIDFLSYDEEFVRVPGKHPCNFFEHATCVATIINHYDRNEAGSKQIMFIYKSNWHLVLQSDASLVSCVSHHVIIRQSTRRIYM